MEGSWELCGEFQSTISCGVLGEDSYIDLFDQEVIRVTTFRKMDDIPELEGVYEDVDEVNLEEGEEALTENNDTGNFM